MPTYTYTARDTSGNVFTGTMEATSKEAVREDLLKMQYHPTSISEEGKAGRSFFGPRRIPLGDLVIFSRQFAAMYHSGIPLIQALNAIRQETENARLKDILQDVHDQLEGGSSLRAAFGRHSNVFSDFFLGMIEAGETGGVLDVTLERVASHVEKQEDLRQKVVSAFAYPVVVGILCSFVIAFLVIFVIPVFASAYSKLNIELPGPTRFLIALSNGIRLYGWALLVVFAAGYLVWTRSRDMPSVHAALDSIALRLPLFGALLRKVAVARFIRTFAVMSQSGVSILDALNIAEKVGRVKPIRQATAAIRASVTAGESVSEPLRAHRIFPSMVVQMASTGEASGNMPELLEKSADFLDQEIDRHIKRLMTKLEPLLTVIVAGVVGLILLAVYMPMFDFLKHATG
ncbi:MAG: type II secretion system F family protein [Planctomycetes bacterium]|nr:type II secretion system F family protein [Planctomycetota bacterium]